LSSGGQRQRRQTTTQQPTRATTVSRSIWIQNNHHYNHLLGSNNNGIIPPFPSPTMENYKRVGINSMPPISITTVISPIKNMWCLPNSCRFPTNCKAFPSLTNYHHPIYKPLFTRPVSVCDPILVAIPWTCNVALMVMLTFASRPIPAIIKRRPPIAIT